MGIARNEFINGNSNLEIYVVQPEGFIDRHYPDDILCLNKSLYGLKQAPRIWSRICSPSGNRYEHLHTQ